MLKLNQFSVHVVCQRDKSHCYNFSFDYRAGVLTKFGQYPSLEDIAGADIKKYRALLRDGYFPELKRANGLASHGIGIGSFVYLRRIFERLIRDHHQVMIDRSEEVPKFETLRVDEKIEALRSELPQALVKNKATYGILSVGLHELDEDTCRKYFPVVRAAIIQILDQDLRAREQLESQRALEIEIAKISGEVKKAAADGKSQR